MTKIIQATLGDPVPCPNKNHGDLWTATWADDDRLYCVADDTGGFEEACWSNLALHVLHGEPPNLRGETINPMAEYGRVYQIDPQDNGNWKAAGLICVDGVLYMTVSRHFYAINELYRPYPIQQASDSSIIKSTDHGQTWSPMPQIGKPMFPGRLFATPFFVEHGKDGTGTHHGADRYIYAISNDGAWNNGNFMILGRVLRERLGRLDPHDWEFVHDYTPDGEPIWRPGHVSACYVFRAPGRASMTGMHYIAPLDVYLLPQWHYHHLDENRPRKHHTDGQFSGTTIELYWAPAPWGPWTLFHSQKFETESWYNPYIPSKFISADGKRFWIFMSGGFGDWPADNPYYALWSFPVTLTTE